MLSRKYLDIAMIVAIFILVTLDALIGDNFEIIKISVFFIVVSLSVFYIKLVKTRFYFVYVLLFILALLYLFNMNGDYPAIKYFVYIVSILFIVNALSKINYSQFFQLILYFSAVSLVLIFMSNQVNYFDVPKNTVGGVAVVLYFALVCTQLKNNSSKVFITFVTILMFLMFLMIDFRGGLIQVAIFFILYIYFISRIPKPSHIITYFFFVSLTLIFFFAIAYLEDFLYYTGLHDFILSVSHRGLNSGRQIIWPIALELALEKPFFGHGSGFLINTFLDQPWSAHNLYLQITLQVGLFGLFSLYILFYTLYQLSLKISSTSDRSLATAFIFCLMVFNCFEVTLLQNSMPIAIFQWFILVYLLCDKVNYESNNDSKC